MPAEKSNTKDALRSEAHRAEIGGDQNMLCDWERAPLTSSGTITIGERTYDRRVCQLNDEHVKLIEQ